MQNQDSDGKELIKFVEGFFRNINAEVKIENEMLVASKISEEFEKAVGKKGPYRLSFNSPMENAEFITKGSTFLKEIMNFIELKGQTTLIKLDFERDYKKEMEHYLSLRNSKLADLSRRVEYKSFTRFSITTILQYLNEKEQITNHICIIDKNIKEFSLDKYKYTEGKKSEINTPNLKEDYELAKEELKKLIKLRVEDTAKNLTLKLDREIERIKGHYDKQKKEFSDSILKLKEQNKNIEVQINKTKEEEKEQLGQRIKNNIILIEKLEKSDTLEKLDKEEQFFITDEKNKHSLKINNKLINTTIIYYPVFNFGLLLKGKETVKKVDIEYDPFKDLILKGVNCDNCKRDIRELYICTNSHVSCPNCIEECSICNAVLCLKCNKKRCMQCNKKLCKNCYIKCYNCKKEVCKIHSNKNYANDKDYCINCLERCENCGKFSDKTRIKKTTKGNICEKCFRLGKIK